MPSKSQRTDPGQGDRFIEAARKAEADESGKSFEKVFKKRNCYLEREKSREILSVALWRRFFHLVPRGGMNPLTIAAPSSFLRDLQRWRL